MVYNILNGIDNNAFSSEPKPTPETLETTVAKRNETSTKSFLAQDADPNQNNLLARLVMCRVPKSLHVDLPEIGDPPKETVDFLTGYKIKKFAIILIEAGAPLGASDINEFLTYQKTLESKLQAIWAKVENPSDDSSFGCDPGLPAFQEITLQYSPTTNPFIEIINDEVKRNVCISGHEREVCRFASVILPQLFAHLYDQTTDRLKAEPYAFPSVIADLIFSYITTYQGGVAKKTDN